jgi:uncharacterized protein (TIGR03435 family)
MSDVTSVFQRAALDRTVVDRTGLSGRYDFDLEWTPAGTQFGGIYSKAAGLDEESKPDLFSAMQKRLGLRLVGGRGPVDVLRITRLQRPT